MKLNNLKELSRFLMIALIIGGMFLQGCATLRARHAVPADQIYNARIPGMPDVRVVFDSRIAETNWGNAEFYAGIQPVRTPGFGTPDTHDAWRLPAEQRAAAFLKDMLASGIARIAVIGHWGIFRELFRAFCADGQASVVTVVASMDNCAVARLAVDERGTRVIHAWNERAHVADLLD